MQHDEGNSITLADSSLMNTIVTGGIASQNLHTKSVFHSPNILNNINSVEDVNLDQSATGINLNNNGKIEKLNSRAYRELTKRDSGNKYNVSGEKFDKLFNKLQKPELENQFEF